MATPVAPVVTPAPAPEVVEAVSPTAAPRLRVTKRGPATVRAGGTAFFRIRIANDGDATAVAIRVTDMLPGGFSLIRAGSPGARLVGGRPTWRVARVRAGHSRTVYIRVRASAEVRGDRCNRVAVGARNGATAGARACFHITAGPPRRRAVAVTG